MADFERLVELIGQVQYLGGLELALADHLIAHGVTIPVRCKDCIHWYGTEGACLKIYSDGAVSPYAWQYRNADDFCSYGERKDNG